ncbi:MAG: MYG1 family protein [bacterium]|nr:MYG1 family protein [bacterium]
MILFESYSKWMNAITHTAPYHADEVFAIVMLEFLFPVRLLRTRNRDIIDSTNAIVYDVGGEFSAEKKRFDHHQKKFTEARPNGIKYTSAGLIMAGVWRSDHQRCLKTKILTI